MTSAERKLKKHLRELSTAVTTHLAVLDVEMGIPDSIERGKRLANSANALDYANDRVRYFALGIDFRKDKKK